METSPGRGGRGRSPDSGLGRGRDVAHTGRVTSDDEESVGGPEAITLDDLRQRLDGRWDCRAITAGFVGIPRLDGGTPIPRYGRTPAELLENILRAEQQ